MPVLKVRCPECDSTLRQNIEAVDEPTDFTITCPKCDHEFVAEAQPDAPAAGQSKKKPAKTTRRRDDDDDDTPRKKKKAVAGNPNKKWIVGGIAGGVLAVGGIIAAVIALGGPKDKKETAKNDPPAKVEPQPQGSQPGPRPNPGQPTNPGPGKIDPGTAPKSKLPPDDDALLPKIPPPLIIRLDQSQAVPISTPVERPPAAPPLTPDEDPFVRSKGFRVDGALPALPKLPPANQRPLLTLDPGGHSAFIKNVFITPNGDRVITVSEDKAVRVWDSRTGDAIHTIRLPAGPGEEGSLLAAALAPNGKRLAVSGIPLKGVKNGAIPVFILDVEAATLVKTIAAAPDIVTALDFSPDGKRLAVGCADGIVQLFDATTGRSLGQVTAHAANVREVRFLPTAKNPILGTLGADSTVRIWDINAKRNSTLELRGLAPSTIDWSHDGTMLGVGTRAGDILLFGPDGKLIRSLASRSHKGAVVQISRMKFLPNDREIVFCGVGGSGWAGIVSVTTGNTRVPFTAHDNTVMAVNVSEDGRSAVTCGGNNNETFVWSVANGKTITRLCGAGRGIWGIGWAKDGKSIAWGTDNHHDLKEISPLEGTFRFDDFGIGHRPDESQYNQWLRDDPLVKLERLDMTDLGIAASGQQPVVFRLPGKERIYSASALPGRGGKVVIGGAASLVMIDSQSGKLLQTFIGHTGHITAIAPSPGR